MERDIHGITHISFWFIWHYSGVIDFNSKQSQMVSLTRIFNSSVLVFIFSLFPAKLG